ncbi:hypothetical protein CDAR_567571 [Caerostris darwini]|uniref:Uncharacterized protein n=1 Tax=Caerostris darwini TaxID=1538125 RepID=A0AAV4QXT5_9ARAC|nr:hypothetical protein CDAR_567571 [Caerostris darwini]
MERQEITWYFSLPTAADSLWARVPPRQCVVWSPLFGKYRPRHRVFRVGVVPILFAWQRTIKFDRNAILSTSAGSFRLWPRYSLLMGDT